MKCFLKGKEVEKSYNLFDTKEINISVADLLFSTFEEIDFFKGAKDINSFFNKLLDYWNVPSNSIEEIEILKKWVKPVISPLKTDYLSKNPYYNIVKPKPFKSDKYSLDYISFKPYQPFSLTDIQVDEKDNYLERSPLSYFEEEVKYLAISKNNTVWMSLIPNEINTMQPHIDEAKGDVLVFGLGLGYYPFMVSLKEEVKNIYIVEYDQKIIDIFNKHLFSFFPHKEKIHVIKGDAKEYIKHLNKHFDTLFIDLWHNQEDGLPLYLYFKQFERKLSNTRFQYWLEESLIALYRRCLLTVFEESLNNYQDKDYLKAKNDIDRIINEIYFKTKNITINNYDDIYKLLSKESILKLLAK